jgi:4-amino-4-deoxy-L-arabinose transferase-like glycosyltransferase
VFSGCGGSEGLREAADARMKRPSGFLLGLRLSIFFWMVTAAALAGMLLLLPRSPLPWLDETLFASTALSMVRGGPPTPTVLAAFPHIIRVDLFYGPVIGFLGALDVRLLGFSIVSWRMLGFLGAVGVVFSAPWVSGRLDGSRTAMAASAMLVALSQGMGARATSGRLDTVTVMLEMISLACAVRAMRREGFGYWPSIWAMLAGIFCGLAALSTPRAFPFVLGLFVGIGIEIVLGRRRELWARGVIVGVAALAPVWWWTTTQGMTPLGWLRLIAALSSGDKLSASPILHGSWHFFDEPWVPLASGLLFTFVMLLVLGCGLGMAGRLGDSEGQKDDGLRAGSGLRMAAVAVVMNYAAALLTIARFWDYEIFVVPLALPVLMALTAKILRGSGPRVMQRVVIVSWVVLAGVLMAIRSGKVVAWAASYEERDPWPLQNFVSSHLPSGSRVFGPEEFYFYAVENAGAHYLFVRPRITGGLVSKLDHDLDWREQLKVGENVYLIWPKDDNLPRGLKTSDLRLEGSFTAKLGSEPAGWQKAGWGSGYPDTNLYRVVKVAASK